MTAVGYTTTEELARILKTNAVTYADQLEEVILAASGEIDSEINAADNPPTEPWQLALAAQVNIERAVEHWHARPIGFNVIGLDSAMPIRLPRDSWEHYANKLAPLKGDDSWGIA